MKTNSKSNLSIVTQRVFALQNQLTPLSSTDHHSSITSNPNDHDQSKVIAKHCTSGICEIQLNHPKDLNSLDPEMCNIIINHLLEWEKSDKCKLIIIKGNGDKAFSSGIDLKNLLNLLLCNAFDDVAALYHGLCTLHHLVGSITKPYVAFIDGITSKQYSNGVRHLVSKILVGSGVGISINAPFRVATEKTVFAMPENSLGFFPDASASFWMPRLDGKLGIYLGLTGARLKGVDVFYAGIATHFIPSSKINDLQDSLDELASRSCGNIQLIDINRVIESFSADIDKGESYIFSSLIRNAINRCFKYDTIEGILDALRKEKIADDWAKETVRRLSVLSPTSLKVSVQLFNRGSRLSFVGCMRLEYRVAINFIDAPDFTEGIRSVVKRIKPNWNPPTIKQAEDQKIKQRYFEAPNHYEFKPLLNGGNHMDLAYRQFMLPTITEILQVAKKMGPMSTIEYLGNKYNSKDGVKTKIVKILGS